VGLVIRWDKFHKATCKHVIQLLDYLILIKRTKGDLKEKVLPAPAVKVEAVPWVVLVSAWVQVPSVVKSKSLTKTKTNLSGGKI